MNNAEAVNWLINITADIGKTEHQELWHYEQALTEIREMLETEPPRMRGRWIPTEPDEPCFYQCSICRRLNDEKDNFCKNCGAKMEGTE